MPDGTMTDAELEAVAAGKAGLPPQWKPPRGWPLARPAPKSGTGLVPAAPPGGCAGGACKV